MSAHHDHDHAQTACCHTPQAASDPRYRRVLWVALAINLAMFGVEVLAGLQSGSVSLLADAIDFAGDAANYGLSLAVLGMALAWRARAALLKAASMALFGALVLGKVLWSTWHGQAPEPWTMGAVALLALAANVAVALMLYRWRGDGAGDDATVDANMRAVWLCSRNDAIGNVAVVLAALGVLGSHSRWPDLAVAAVMGGLALTAAWSVYRLARAELRASQV